MSGRIDVAELMVLALGFEVALLGITGMFHIVRPAHLQGAAAHHHRFAAIPTWLRPLERPILIGGFEIVCAGTIAASAVTGRADVVALGQLVVTGFAAALLSFVSLLRRAAESLPCGCHPWAGRVTSASYLPAASLFVVAVAAVATALLQPARPVAIGTGALVALVLVGAIAALTVLLYAGAATPAVEV